MKKAILLLATLVMSFSIQAKSKTESAGDYLQFAVPLAGFGVAWQKNDTEGMWQLGKGVLITAAITHATKWAVEAERPNGKSFNSFPSGHTSAAFSGASFLHHRYGIEYGLPAYLAATYVGYSRVYASKHWDIDVLAGAALAYTVSHFVTTEFNDPNLSVAPARFGKTDAQGIILNYSF